MPASTYCTSIIRLCLIGLMYIGSVTAQNLVPNPDFETYVMCPPDLNQGTPLECPPWFRPSDGTSDYFHTCAQFTTFPQNQAGIPNNAFGIQLPNSGDAYAGFYVKLPLANWREYLSVQFTSPLIEDHCYRVSFYISLGDYGCGANRIEGYISETPPPNNGTNPINVTPQINTTPQYYLDDTGWTLIEDYYYAEGGEQYLTIGNFNNDFFTLFHPSCDNGTVHAYYYLDDVTVEEIDPEIGLDLEGPVFTCDSFTINPGLGNVEYIWSDGTTGSTLTVYESGIYGVTVSTACSVEEDEIEVIVNNLPPLQLPEDSLLLCEGEVFTLGLNPDAGEYTWSDGTTGPELTITSPGIYTVTLDDGCDFTSGQIVVEYMSPPPPISLGEDVIVCPGDDVEFNFNANLGDFEWSNGENTSDVILVEPGLYSVTVSNMCGSESDEVLLIGQTPPEIDLIEDVYLCDLEPVVISLDSGEGNYVWQDGTTGPTYIISLPGTYSVTVSNECGSVSGDLIASDAYAPEINWGPIPVLCPGDTLVLDADQGPGDYEWQDGSSFFSYTITQPGLYALSITNACGFDSESIMVEYAAVIAQPDLGPDQSLCPGDTLTLQVNSQTADIWWQDGSSADSLVITSNGLYTVTLSSACQTVSDTIQVAFSADPPSLNLPDTLTLCDGDSLLLDPSIPNVSYDWSDGSEGAQLLISLPGVYSVTATSTCGTDADTVMVMDAGGLPLVDLGPDTSFCSGDTLWLNPVVTGAESWVWPDGSLNGTYTVTDSAWVVLVAVNECGSSSDTLRAHLLESLPEWSMVPDTILCPGESVTLAIDVPGVDILWSDGTTENTQVADQAGIYVASISNACETKTDSVIITVWPPIPALELGPDIPLCPGESFVLNPGISGVDYLWHDGSTDSIYLIDKFGLISLTLTGRCGSVTDFVNVFEDSTPPDLDLGNDIDACMGDTVILMANVPGVDYSWQDGSVLNQYSVTHPGTYTLMVANACGSDSDTVSVMMQDAPLPVDLGMDTVLCEGEIMTWSLNPGTGDDLMWSDGSANPVFTTSEEGVFYATVTNRCGTSTDTVVVRFQSLPVAVTLGSDTTLCPGEVLVLQRPVTSDQVWWPDGSSGSTFIVDQPGQYTIIIENRCGQQTDDILVSYDQQTPVLTLPATIDLCEQNNFTLNALQSFPAMYAWNTGAATPSIIVSEPGIYSVTVQTPCYQISQSVEAFQNPGCYSGEFFIPNVFTPNGDGTNEVFSFFHHESITVTSVSGSIFDRWGNLIYLSDHIPFIWDGTFAGKPMLPGTYVYMLHIRYRFLDLEYDKVWSGDVTLIR